MRETIAAIGVVLLSIFPIYSSAAPSSRPNIDKLADEGIKFNNAFAISGGCSPTRATLLSDLIPSQTGIHGALPPAIDVPDWPAIEEFRSLLHTMINCAGLTAAENTSQA